ncbi:MAG TPA: VWA domain-containing protein [Solirubrobacteraceae bacterium]|nr:VWA domain-containing protein [Solirubrobacteraceae bacterium]
MRAVTEGRRIAIAIGTCLLMLAGCGGSDGETPTIPKQRPLPAGWYEDPDGDLVPTAVEDQLGTDPLSDACAREAGCASAGRGVNAIETSNTLLILDSSGSMKGSAGGSITKMAAAKRALRRYVAGTPDSMALGFMVYGHKGSNGPSGKARSCAGVELLQPIAPAASQRFDATLRRFRPIGYTPLAAALRTARSAFDGKQDDVNRIILVTDGVETCGGNPVAEARRLKQAGIHVTTDVVGFDIGDLRAARRLRAIAEASGGTYSDARSAESLYRLLDDEIAHNAELITQYLCVTASGSTVSLCREGAVGSASIAMDGASDSASIAGRDAESREIDRLRKAMEAAGVRRDEAFDRGSDVVAQRLQREVDASRRRLDALER